MTPRSLPRSVRLAPAVLLAVLAACGPDVGSEARLAATGPTAIADPATETAAGAASVRVEISQSRFSERVLEVAAGTTVVWENTDEFAHTVTSTEGSPIGFDSGQFRLGETFELTFDEPGEYAYFCMVHPTMRATVIVT